MADFIVDKLKSAITNASLDVKKEEIGRVVELGDGICKISGLGKAKSQEMLEIETKEGNVTAIALNLEEDMIGAVLLGDYSGVKEGATVRSTGNILSIPVSDNMIGRVVDPLGRPVDGKGPIDTKEGKLMSIEKKAPGVIDRESVNTPVHTGIKAIDAMIPIGRGQRELIIGDRQTGKTAIALDTIINQQNDQEFKTPICIYVAIGQREAKVARIVAELESRGAMEYTIVVSAPNSSPAALWYLAPFAGAAIGEFFMERGDDAIVVFDDLSKHATSYRQISLLLRRPPGREAYPGDIFYLHSRLLERSAKLSKEKGGGSLTALPIIETQLGDVSAYIPTNVISITDGQIYLQPELFNQGIRPAVNVGLSVSRVGSSAQTKAMKKVAGRLRLELAQFRELQAFVQFASDLDESTRKRIKRGIVLTELLKQLDFAPIPFEQETAIIYLGVNGHLDALEKEDVPEYVEGFIDYLQKRYQAEVLDALRQSKEMTDEIKAKLDEAISKYAQVNQKEE